MMTKSMVATVGPLAIKARAGLATIGTGAGQRAAEARPGPRPDRRFWSLFALSLLIHAALLLWVQRPQRAVPALPPLLATLRLVVDTSSGATSEAHAAPASTALPPAAKQPPPRREQRQRRVVEAATPAVDVPAPALTPAAMAESRPASLSTPGLVSTPTSMPALNSDLGAVANAASALSPDSPSQSSLLAAYRQRLSDIFAGQQQYPRVAALRGWEGEVRLHLRVARKGNLVAVRLDHSSGFAVLDQHALAMLEQLASLPPLPEGLEASEIQVVVPVNYKLKKST